MKWKISWWWLKPFVWIWNPFPRNIKIRSGKGGYILDIKQRRWSRKLEEAERLRRRREGEDDRKYFKIQPRGNVELEGRSK